MSTGCEDCPDTKRIEGDTLMDKETDIGPDKEIDPDSSAEIARLLV
jgi:hypothetical protein